MTEANNEWHCLVKMMIDQAKTDWAVGMRDSILQWFQADESYILSPAYIEQHLEMTPGAIRRLFSDSALPECRTCHRKGHRLTAGLCSACDKRERKERKACMYDIGQLVNGRYYCPGSEHEPRKAGPLTAQHPVGTPVWYRLGDWVRRGSFVGVWRKWETAPEFGKLRPSQYDRLMVRWGDEFFAPVVPIWVEG